MELIYEASGKFYLSIDFIILTLLDLALIIYTVADCAGV